MLSAIETCHDLLPWNYIKVCNGYEFKESIISAGRNMVLVHPGACGRDSANTLQDEKRVPYLKDCLRMGLQRATDNEFVAVSRPEVSVNKFDPPADAFYAHRLTPSSFSPICDLFGARKNWWKERMKEIPDLLLGSDFYWSHALWAMFKKYGAKDVTGVCYREEKT